MAPTAMASLYHLSLDDVVASNSAKVRFRSERGAHTPLYDQHREAHEQFPRLRAIDYKVAFTRGGADVICTATAIADVGDVSN